MKVKFYQPLQGVIESLTTQFASIPNDRKTTLEHLTNFIVEKRRNNQKIELIFICTHNSRRSHIAQLWAQTAAAYYGIPDLVSYSGGTEATAFNPRAVKALKDAGFKIYATSVEDNPVYEVRFSDDANKMSVYSKKYDAESNPKKAFAAIMTCAHADENCPVVFGMEKKISLPYDDPKDFDGLPNEATKYTERVMEIGKEIFFAFSLVKT